ncbi:MAG: carbohydrate kinase family protein, partial [Anaerolineales bacterium]|nr:carbohydrate kinase family protein [Anaerolineales bacterium]
NGYNVPVVDSTGAGDTFNAAFLTSTIADYSLEKRIEFACAAGAISVTGLGPKGHLPSFDETFEFMSMNEENTK